MSAERLHQKHALYELHPQHTAFVPAALLVCTGLLAAALSLPLMDAQQLIFWKNSFSVWQGVAALWKENEPALAAILFFFSMVFPIVKLAGLIAIWCLRLPQERRNQVLHWLGLLGKWSMLDVFVVAILIVLVKIGPLARVTPRIGIYVFASAIFASMLTTTYIDNLAKQSLRSR